MNNSEGQTQEPVGIDDLINEFYEAYRRFEKDPDEDETQYNRGVREGKSITYANVVSRMRQFLSASLPGGLPNDIHLYKFIGTATDSDPVFPFVLHVFQLVETK